MYMVASFKEANMFLVVIFPMYTTVGEKQCNVY